MKSKLIEKYGATALTVLTSIGVVATGYLTVRATLKANDVLKDEELSKGDKFKKAAPHYILPCVVGAVTIGTAFGANTLNKKQQAALMSSYVMLNEFHKAYRQKNIEINGEEADEKVCDALARTNCNYHSTDMATCPDYKRTFVDHISGDEIVGYERDIIDAEYHLNKNYMLGGAVSVTEWREFLGLPYKKEYDDQGWEMSSGVYFVEFEHQFLKDGRVLVYPIFYPDKFEEW